MLEKITYIANDGTEFSSEDDCMIHDRGLTFANAGDGAKFFDEDFQELIPDVNHLEYVFGTAKYFVIIDPKKVEFLFAVSDEYGYDQFEQALRASPPSLGDVYEYDYNLDVFVKVSDIISEKLGVLRRLSASMRGKAE